MFLLLIHRVKKIIMNVILDYLYRFLLNENHDQYYIQYDVYVFVKNSFLIHVLIEVLIDVLWN